MNQVYRLSTIPGAATWWSCSITRRVAAIVTTLVLVACSEKNTGTQLEQAGGERTSANVTQTKLQELQKQLALYSRLDLPRHVEIQLPSDDERVMPSARNAQRDEVSALLDKLVPRPGDDIVPQSETFNRLVEILSGDDNGNATKIEALDIPPIVKQAVASVVAADDGKKSRVNALKALVEAKDALPPPLTLQFVKALLLTPEQSPIYADLYVEFGSKFFSYGVEQGTLEPSKKDELIDAMRQDTLGWQQLSALIGAVPRGAYAMVTGTPAPAGTDTLSAYYRKAIAQTWEALGGQATPSVHPKGEFETTSAYQERVKAETAAQASAAERAKKDLQVQFGKQFNKVVGGDSWKIRNMAYNADAETFTGEIVHVQTGTRIPASVKVPRARAASFKEELNNKDLRPIYGIDLTKTLTVIGFGFVLGDRFAVSSVAWDTKMPLGREEAGKYQMTIAAVEKEEQLQAQANRERAAAQAVADLAGEERKVYDNAYNDTCQMYYSGHTAEELRACAMKMVETFRMIRRGQGG